MERTLPFQFYTLKFRKVQNLEQLCRTAQGAIKKQKCITKGFVLRIRGVSTGKQIPFERMILMYFLL